MIRKYEPKPIRIFLQDGSSDLNIYGGDWWMANQEMERAFRFAGYEVNHDWGTGGHSGEHATRIFSDAMRWLWKDWPEPVKAGLGSPQLQEILIPGEGWTLGRRGLPIHRRARPQRQGEVFFNDIPNGKAYKIGLDGKREPVYRRAPNTRTARLLGRMAGSMPPPPVPARFSPMTPTASPP